MYVQYIEIQLTQTKLRVAKQKQTSSKLSLFSEKLFIYMETLTFFHKDGS